jgi:hypothetical protein
MITRDKAYGTIAAPVGSADHPLVKHRAEIVLRLEFLPPCLHDVGKVASAMLRRIIFHIEPLKS